MKITIRNLQKKIPISPKRIKRLVLKTLSEEAFRKPGEITLCFMDDKKIAKLNKKFLHKLEATDVLAFDISGKSSPAVRWDMAVSCETAMRNARIFDTALVNEIYLYVIHGVLHLLGYDHRAAKGRQLMEKKSRQILSRIKE